MILCYLKTVLSIKYGGGKDLVTSSGCSMVLILCNDFRVGITKAATYDTSDLCKIALL